MKFGSGKKKAPQEHPGTVEEASAGSSGYPESLRVSALRERRLLISLRGVSFALIMAIILNAVQAFTIVGLMPLKEVRPFLVQIAEEGTLVAAIQPIRDTFEAKDVLTEKLVREYVVTRHEILEILRGDAEAMEPVRICRYDHCQERIRPVPAQRFADDARHHGAGCGQACRGQVGERIDGRRGLHRRLRVRSPTTAPTPSSTAPTTPPP